MLEKHDVHNKYTLAELSNGEVRRNNNNNVFEKAVSVFSEIQKNDEDADTDGDVLRTKKFRNALPQILATCAKNLLLLTYGMTLGITTIAIPALDANSNVRNTSDLQRRLRSDVLTLTKDEISWFSSIHLICVPLGCFISGAITQPLGRKRSMMALNVPFFIVWVLYYNATSVSTLYIALVISGLAGGLHEAPVLTYVAEITEPYLRGMLGSTAPTTVIVGTVSQLVLGNFYHWRSVVLFNMAFPVIAFIALCFVPESPHWLISKGRYEDAEKSLCWLRGWVSPNEVQRELSMLKKIIRTRNKENKTSLRETFQSYGNRTFIIPHLIVIATFFVGHFGGMMSIQTNAVKLFGMLGSPVDEYQSTLILGVVEFAGAVVCVILVHWTGKRMLLISTTAGCAACLLILASFDYYRSEQATFITSLAWVPIIFLNTYAFLIHAGIRLLPWVLIGEMYPTEIRAFASGASALWFYVFAFIVNKNFQGMLDTVKLYGLFTLYGSVILIGSIFFFFFLPETEGLTLHEIERHFARKGNIFKTRIRKHMNQTSDEHAPADGLKSAGTNSYVESPL